MTSFLALLKVVTTFLSGPLGNIAKEIRLAHEAKLNAKNDSERIAADERIARLEAQRNVIVASQPDLIWRICRAGIAFPFIVYLNKVVLWDKVLQWGTTDNLSADLWYLLYIVVGGFFIEVGARIARR